MKLDKIKFNFNNFSDATIGFLARKSRLFLALISLVIFGYAAFLWYAFMINPQWSDSQKQEYMSTKQNETVFDQKNFETVIGEIEKRKVEYGKNIDNAPDIFRLK